MKSKFLKAAAVIVAATVGLSAAFAPATSPENIADLEITDETPLWNVMTRLGKIKPNAPKNPDDQELLEQGRSLVENGYAMRKGTKSKSLGKFTCANCHLSKPTSKDLKNFDPEVQLRYVNQENLPFLPGSTFYGVVNRAFFFNDDVLKGLDGPNTELIEPAHFDLRAAISACNQVFGQGRALKDWEKEAILMYFWSMELKIGELNLSEEDLEKVKFAIKNNRSNARAVNILRRNYPEVYPMNMVGAVQGMQRRTVSPVASNFSVGRILYDRSCLQCHGESKLAKPRLDYKKKTFKRLRDNFNGKDSYNIYKAHRQSSSEKWDGRIFFTKEHLSNQQLEDLRYFIQTMARDGEKALRYYGDNY